MRAPLCITLGLFAASTPCFGQSPKAPDPKFDITLDDVSGQRHYRHPLRPQLHYTPLQGHIGDATGLFYYAGEYPLLYLYDQWSRRRAAHKQWGHAVSRDLVNWEELPAVRGTLVDNRPGSGSGIVDWKDSAGLRQGGPEKTVMIFYTDYERGTGIAYSRLESFWNVRPSRPVRLHPARSLLNAPRQRSFLKVAEDRKRES
jgi:sucrose-6-phosphate hydrolase SacC (GH32 family)